MDILFRNMFEGDSVSLPPVPGVPMTWRVMAFRLGLPGDASDIPKAIQANREEYTHAVGALVVPDQPDIGVHEPNEEVIPITNSDNTPPQPASAIKELPMAYQEIIENITRQLMEQHLLSPREKEVTSHLLAGLSNKEIASKLYISTLTVKSHLLSIYEKVGISNRILFVLYMKGLA